MKNVFSIILAFLYTIFVEYLHVTMFCTGSAVLLYALSQFSIYIFLIGIGIYLIVASVILKYD